MYLIRHGLFLGVLISEIFRSELPLARKMQKTKNWKIGVFKNAELSQ